MAKKNSHTPADVIKDARACLYMMTSSVSNQLESIVKIQGAIDSRINEWPIEALAELEGLDLNETSVFVEYARHLVQLAQKEFNRQRKAKCQKDQSRTVSSPRKRRVS